MTLINELVPENLLSRVLSFDYFGSFALTPVGFVIAGVAAGIVAPTTVLAVGGTIGVTLWFVPLCYRQVRKPVDANLYALGVWRSLVARSVRVGEVPSSNLGTPMRAGTQPPRAGCPISEGLAGNRGIRRADRLLFRTVSASGARLDNKRLYAKRQGA